MGHRVMTHLPSRKKEKFMMSCLTVGGTSHFVGASVIVDVSSG